MSVVRFAVFVGFSCLAQLCAAQGVSERIVGLEAGKWMNQQTTYINGKVPPGGSFTDEECVSEADSNLTVAAYIQKFLNSVGPDVTCNISSVNGAPGEVTADVSCTGEQGATTNMSLRYQYSPRRVEVTGQGLSSVGGTSFPVSIVASSMHMGSCS